jgi:hypothetical protein
LPNVCTSGAVDPAATSLLPLIPQVVTGLWYDPAYDGAGFNITMTPSGLLAYYFGWDKSGNRLWLMSELGPLSATPGIPITLAMNQTMGGRLMTPAHPSTSAKWGTLTIDFAKDGGFTATGRLSGLDGTVDLALQKLTDAVSPASITGAWYDPAYDGAGFNMTMTPLSMPVYYYGWDKDGNRLWLVSGSPGGPQPPFRTGSTVPIHLSMWQTNGGRFATPAKPSTLTQWGALEIRFTGCTQATATLSGNDGSIVVMNNLQMLAGVLGMPTC